MGQGKCLVGSLQGLVRIAKKPERGPQKRGKTPQGPAIEEGMRAVLLGIVQGNALLQVRAGRGEFSTHRTRLPPCHMGLQQETGILYALGQVQALLCQFVRRLELRPRVIKRP